MENWKHIKGYEGKYQISDQGRVKSFNYGSEPFILKGSLTGIEGKKYYEVLLGRGNRFKIHRLVALHFVDNPQNKPCINHIDGNKLNNRADNLEFVTVTENNQHAWDNGLKKGVVVLNTETGIYYELMKDAAEAHNIRYKNLSRYMNGTRPNKTPFVSV